jgi:hypothetical protein
VDLARRLVRRNPAVPGRPENIVTTGRALIAEAEGHPDEALAAFREADGRWAAYGSIPEQARALVGQGRCLIALGHPAEATEPLLSARELFSPLGASRPIAEIDDLLAQTAARAG